MRMHWLQRWFVLFRALLGAGLLLLGGDFLLHAKAPPQFRQLTQGDGLPSDRIQAIAEDDLGNLWIGTNGGLVKFDGADFYRVDLGNTWSLDQTSISCLFHDSQKNMWIGTMEFGLYAVNTRTWEIRAFFHDTGDSASLPDNRITTIFEDQKGQVWFGAHRKGICRLVPETQKFEAFRASVQLPGLEPREADVIMEGTPDPFDSNRVWLGTLQGLFSMDNRDGKLEHWWSDPADMQDEAEYTRLVNLVRGVYQQNAHTLWLGTWGGGLCRLDLRDKGLKPFYFEKRLPVNQVRNVIRRIVPKSENELWVLLAGDRREIGIFNLDSQTFSFPFAKQLSDRRIIWTAFLQGRNGNLWAGSAQGLFVQVNRPNPFHFKSLPFSVKEVCPHPDGKRLLMALHRQKRLLVEELETGSLSEYPFRPLLDKGHQVNAIENIHFLPNGKILVVENTDVYYFDSAKDSLQLGHKIDVASIRSNLWGFLDTEIDAEGNLWLGNKYAGLFYLNLKTGELQHFEKAEEGGRGIVHTAWIFDLMRDQQGNIWYGTEEGWGYHRRRDDQFVNFHYDSQRSGKPGIQLKAVSSLTTDAEGRIWLGSPHRGLAVMDAETRPDAAIRTFTVEDGLRDDVIRTVCAGADENLWIITRAGLSQLNIYDYTIHNFGKEYGLNHLEKVSIGANGTVYIGSKGGYFYFNPDDLRLETKQTKVLLRSFRVFGEDFRGPMALNYLEEVTLNYDENFLSFEYAALNFFNPELVEYAYQMEGVDQDWVAAGKRKFCNYTDLMPGKHRFRVRARIEDQAWGPITELAIVILPPFWQTWWFILALLIASGLTIYLVVKWRINLYRQQVAVAQEFNDRLQDVEKKALQAQMNPHFLFNCLNSIKLLILKAEKEKAAAYLTTFSKLIRLVLQNSEQTMIRLADELQALELYMQLERLRLNEKFDFEIQIESGLHPERLKYPPLVLQPMVENAIWHGLSQKRGHGKLQVVLATCPEGLEVVVHDNGIGREAAHHRSRESAKGKSFGLAITRERLRLAFPELGAGEAKHLQIEDLYTAAGTAAGTRVRILTPLLPLANN